MSPRRFLPKNVAIIGYARSKLDVRDLRATVAEHLKGATEDVSRFLDLVSYLPGTYDSAPGFQVRQPLREIQRLCVKAVSEQRRQCLSTPALPARRRCRRCW